MQSDRAELSRPPDLSWNDIEIFLSVYERAMLDDVELRTTLTNLFDGTGIPPTTVISQLKKILAYLGIKPERRRGPGFDVLFKEHSPGEGLRPTEAATALFNRFMVMRDLYYQTPAAVGLAGGEAKRELRIGATQIFAYRLLPPVMSIASSVFPDLFPETELPLTIRPATQLLAMVKAGLLDVAFLFVPENNPHGVLVKEQPYKDICTCSLGHKAELVLLSHPDSPIPMRKDSRAAEYERTADDMFDANLGYWKKSYERGLKKSKKNPEYKRLRELEILDMDFSHERMPALLLVRSWGQPEGFAQMRDAAKKHRLLEEVENHDTGLALTRARNGVTVAPQGYSWRKGITAFKLRYEGRPLERWVGAAWSETFRLSPEASLLMKLFQVYRAKFENKIDDDGLPDFFDLGLTEVQETIRKGKRDWRDLFEPERPTEDYRI